MSLQAYQVIDFGPTRAQYIREPECIFAESKLEQHEAVVKKRQILW